MSTPVHFFGEEYIFLRHQLHGHYLLARFTVKGVYRGYIDSEHVHVCRGFVIKTWAVTHPRASYTG